MPCEGSLALEREQFAQDSHVFVGDSQCDHMTICLHSPEEVFSQTTVFVEWCFHRIHRSSLLQMLPQPKCLFLSWSFLLLLLLTLPWHPVLLLLLLLGMLGSDFINHMLEQPSSDDSGIFQWPQLTN